MPCCHDQAVRIEYKLLLSLIKKGKKKYEICQNTVSKILFFTKKKKQYTYFLFSSFYLFNI